MKLADRALAAWRNMTKSAVASSPRSSVWGSVREPFAGAWQRNISIEPIGGLTAFSAVFACITRRANDIAKLRPRLMMQQGGISIPAPETSPYWRVLRKPNTYQNHIQFILFWMLCKLMYGNAYALIGSRDGNGIVTSLYLLDPRRVTPQVTPQGDVYYSISGDDLSRVPTGATVPASYIIHDRADTLWHPLVGISPLYACGIAATQGLKIQTNSAKFFENMSRPSGMLTAPGTIGEETAARLKTEWENNYSGMNIGRMAILGDGLKYEAMTIPAEAAQLIEQLNWTVADVARAFGVPLHKIAAGPEPATGSTEARQVQYYTDTLQKDIEAIELCLTQGLEVPTGYEVEFDLDGLIRMDSAAQMDLVVKGVGGAILKPNEGRAKFNLPPTEGGDQAYLQQQNYSLPALAKRDAREDPFASSNSTPPEPKPAPPMRDEVEPPDTEDKEAFYRQAVEAIEADRVAAANSTAELITEMRLLVQQGIEFRAPIPEVDNVAKETTAAMLKVAEAIAGDRETSLKSAADLLAEVRWMVQDIAQRSAPLVPVEDEDEVMQLSAVIASQLKCMEIEIGA